MLLRRPPMNIKGFNKHALKEATHVARSLFFVSVATLSIDRQKSFAESSTLYRAKNTLVYVQTKVYIVIDNIKAMCASIHITYAMHIAVQDIEDNVRVKTYCSDEYG